MNKGLRIFGHPVHAIMASFPIALLGTSLIWDVIGMWRDDGPWWSISFWNIALGLVIALVTATAGAIDYAAIKQSDQVMKVATTHMILMLCAVTTYGGSLLLRGGPGIPTPNHRVIIMAIEFIGLILLVVGGWFGGDLVFKFGVGHDQSN
jgi:uncharacterized membrane protein